MLVLFVGCLAVLGGTGGGGGGSKENANSDETFTAENYGTLVANPEAHSGARVEITGQLLEGPEQRGGEVAFQMWADPVKVDWNTLVRADESSLDLRGDDYVRVEGSVLGAFDGENAFGGAVTAVEVEADDVQKVEAVDAVDPTIATAEVNETLEAEGFTATIERVEFAERNTRVYMSASNEGDKAAKIDSYRSRVFQGDSRVGQKDPFEYSLPKPRGAIQPGEQTEGVLIFGAVDPEQPFEISLAWERGGLMSDTPDPLVFEVTP